MKEEYKIRYFPIGKKLFYNTITSTDTTYITPPSKEQIINSWSNMWNDPVPYNEYAKWIKDNHIHDNNENT